MNDSWFSTATLANFKLAFSFVLELPRT